MNQPMLARTHGTSGFRFVNPGIAPSSVRVSFRQSLTEGEQRLLYDILPENGSPACAGSLTQRALAQIDEEDYGITNLWNKLHRLKDECRDAHRRMT